MTPTKPGGAMQVGSPSTATGVFTLRLTFIGLCLFVRDRNRLHVLLINFDHQGVGDDHVHHACLVYDKAYATGGSTPAKDLACPSLTRKLIELTGFDDDPFIQLDEPSIVPLEEIAGVAKLDRVYLGLNPNANISARVTIGSGALSNVAPGLQWTCAAAGSQVLQCLWHRVTGVWPRRFSHRVEWTIRDIPLNSSGQWPVPLHSLDDGGQITPQLTLNPMGGVIELYVYNAPGKDLPPAQPPTNLPGPGHRVPHFAGYYQVTSGGTHVIPVLDERAKPSKDPLPYPSDCSGRRPVPGGPVSGHSSTCVSAQIDAA
jgi:hypothetical protein